MIIRENDNRIDELELAMVDNMPLVSFPLVHRFTKGMYIREIFMPKGSILTSKIHKTEHPFTVSCGVAAVSIDGGEWEYFEAPHTGITKAGTRRVLCIMEDCVWTTYHPIDWIKSDFNEFNDDEIEKIVDKIEDEILEPHINFLTGTDISKEYRNILESTKKIQL